MFSYGWWTNQCPVSHQAEQYNHSKSSIQRLLALFLVSTIPHLLNLHYTHQPVSGLVSVVWIMREGHTFLHQTVSLHLAGVLYLSSDITYTTAMFTWLFLNTHLPCQLSLTLCHLGIMWNSHCEENSESNLNVNVISMKIVFYWSLRKCDLCGAALWIWSHIIYLQVWLISIH